jgi:ethanolamine utilization cobalamin adenosyltransferase
MEQITELPDDWYEEESGQSLVLDYDKVLAEINRLRAIISEMENDAHNAGIERDFEF